MNVKQISLFAALAAALALSGCQRNELEVGNSGVKEVNTQFVFNVATSSARTKQAADAVQEGESPSFRGITDAKLMTYVLDQDGLILKADATAPKVYDLAQLVPAGTGPRRVVEMSLPLQTNTLLLYGRAPQGGAKDVFTAYDYYGHLDKYEVKETVGSANFQLGKRLQDATGFYAMEKLIAGILTVIMNTSMTAADVKSAITAGGFAVGEEEEFSQLWWSMYYKPDQEADSGMSPVESGKHQYPLEERLGHLYREMVNIRYVQDGATELRAGSGEATLRIVQDLWSVINAVRCAAPLSRAETVAKAFAEKVSERLGIYFSYESLPTNGSPVTGVNFKAVSEIAAHLIGGEYNNQTYSADVYWPNNAAAHACMPTSGEITAIGTKLTKEFPDNYNSMRGAAYMNFDQDKYYFYYPKYFNTSEVGGIPGDADEGYSAESYYYPAELLYFGNSPLRTSALEHVTADYPESVADWKNETKWSAEKDGKADWTGTHVMSTTHSVAMKYPIRYGVSMLETKVGYSSEVLGYANPHLKDNNHAVQNRLAGGNLNTDDEPDREIAVGDGSFLLTGIVVGGQTQNVGWDFLPISDPVTGKKITGFIYDKAVTSQQVKKDNGSGFTPNYTVVFDNYSAGGYGSRNPENSGDFGQDKVYVALEFQNKTGVDFYGNFNLIRNDGYFYLIGELDPTKSEAFSFEDGFEIPPYLYDGGTYVGIPRVFMQDYKTSVTFKFGPNSLKYAYLSVPDLRASSLTLGLSVDIKWKQGLEYGEVILGGN